MWVTWRDGSRISGITVYEFEKAMASGEIPFKFVSKNTYVHFEDLRRYCEEKHGVLPDELRSRSYAFALKLDKEEVIEVESILRRRGIKLVLFEDPADMLIAIGRDRPRWVIAREPFPFVHVIRKVAKTFVWKGDKKELWKAIKQ